MSKDTSEESNDTAGAGKKKILPMAIILVAGLLVGGGAGAFGAGPLLAGRSHAEAPSHGKAAGDDEDHGDSGDADDDESGDAEHDEEKESDEADAHAVEAKPMHTIDNLVLNPSGSGGTRYLMLSVAVEVKDDAVAEQMKARDAEVRDAVLHVLGSKTVDELADIAARDSLKLELRDSIRGLFRKKAVRRVYLPQFVIQ